MKQRSKRRWLNIARILISTGLLLWVFTTIDFLEFVRLAAQADRALLGTAYALGVSSMFVRALRWHTLLRSIGIRLRFGRSVYLYFAGQFFSSFLPTGFAGDAVKVLELHADADAGRAAGAVLVDRLAGFVSLFFIALLALPFAGDLIPRELAGLVAALSAAVLIGAFLLFQGAWLRRLTRRLPNMLSLAGDGFVGRTYAAIIACGGRALGLALLLSTVFNLQWMAAIFAVAKALRLDVSFGHVVLFTPLTVTALLAPFAISGLGVREGMFIALYSQPLVGLSAAGATALGLGTFTLDLVNGLIGGVIYLSAGALGLRKRGRVRTNAE